MRAPWLPLTLLAPAAVAACGGEAPDPAEQERLAETLAAWSEAQDPSPAAGAPADPGAVPGPPFATDPETLAGRHLVILPGSGEPGAQVSGLDRLAAHPALLAEVQRASSTWFAGFPPCREITFAGAFEHRRQATARARELEGLGLQAEVAEAGAYLGPQRPIAAWCRRAPTPRGPQACADARFAEVHDGQVWMWLALDEEATTAALAESGAPAPLGDLDTWFAPVPGDAHGGHRKGDAWRVVAPGSGRAVGTCRISRFAALTRGEPHASWRAQEPAPTAPGCGAPELFARLDCRAAPDEPLLASRGAAPAPVLYTALAPLRDIELEDAAKAVVSRSPGFTEAFAGAQAQALERSAPLQQLVSLTGFVARGTKVLLVQVSLQTGDGVTGCGRDDVRVDLAAVHAWARDGRIGPPIVPLHAVEGAEILGLIDLAGDGTLELFERAWPGTLRLDSARGPSACALERGYCTSPCG